MPDNIACSQNLVNQQTYRSNKMELFKIFAKLVILAGVQVHGGSIDYLARRILLADWLGLTHIQSEEAGAIMCAHACTSFYYCI